MSRSIEITNLRYGVPVYETVVIQAALETQGITPGHRPISFFVHPGDKIVSWVKGGAVFEEIVGMFLYIAVFSSVLSGLGNGAYYYFQMTYLHRGIQGLSKSKRIILAGFFAAATASLTLAFMVGVAILVLPFFQHQFLL